MALPKPSRPPGRQQGGRRWVWVTLLTLIGIGLPATIVFNRPVADRTRGWEIVADRFVEGIVLGTGTETEGTSGGRTGFEIAYDLLAESRRASLPFDVFFEDWTRLCDERGFIVDHIRVGNHDARGRPRDPICFLLFLGGEQQEHAKLNTVRLEITLQRRGSRYAVAEYVLKDVPNPRAAR